MIEIEILPDGKYAVKDVFENGSTLLAMCENEREAQEIAKVFEKRNDRALWSAEDQQT